MVLLGVACLLADARTAGIALVGAVFVLVPLVRFFVLDRLFRDRIREQLATLNCTVLSIAWRPFQGWMFGRGWKRRRRCRFYEVVYSERDGTEKTELCAVGFWIGPLWGDEIDSFGGVSDLGGGRAALLPYIGGGGVVLVALFSSVIEFRYAVSGRTAHATITRVSEVHAPQHRRDKQRGKPQTAKTLVEYEFAEADGSIRQESVVQSSLAMLARGHQPVKVEYIPGAKGWSRLAGQTRLGWVYGLAALALILVTVRLLDRFDVFGLHRSTE